MTDTCESDEIGSAPAAQIPTTHKAIEFRDETLVYDRKNPERWVQSTESVSLGDVR